MRCFFSPNTNLALPASHPAQLERYHILRNLVASEGICKEKKIHQVTPVSADALQTLHCPIYLEKIQNGSLSSAEQTLLQLPNHPNLFAYAAAAAAATHLTCLSALEEGCAASLASTQPYASYQQAQQFSVFNDIAYTIKQLHLAQPNLRIFLLNTSSRPCQELSNYLGNNPSIYHYSLHSLRADEPACGDMDISLPRYAEDYIYQPRLLSSLAQAFDRFSPELVIWIAGVDAHRHDAFGDMYLSSNALAQRDAALAQTFLKHRLPLATLIGPGSNKSPQATALLHLQTLHALALAAKS